LLGEKRQREPSFLINLYTSIFTYRCDLAAYAHAYQPRRYLQKSLGL
jgi:hypothetical protein